MKTETQLADERLQDGIAQVVKNLAAEGQISRAEAVARLLDRFSILSKQTRTLDTRVLERLTELEHKHVAPPCEKCDAENAIHRFVKAMGLSVADLRRQP